MIRPRRTVDERGSLSIEAVLVIPAVMLIGMLLFMAGRLAMAHGAVESAADEAARSASIARSAQGARDAATDTANSTLANSGLVCTTTRVTTNTAAFDLPVGQTGPVTVTVTCRVKVSDLGIPGVHASRRVTATGQSAIDAYRSHS